MTCRRDPVVAVADAGEVAMRLPWLVALLSGQGVIDRIVGPQVQPRVLKLQIRWMPNRRATGRADKERPYQYGSWSGMADLCRSNVRLLLKKSCRDVLVDGATSLSLHWQEAPQRKGNRETAAGGRHHGGRR